MTKGDKPKTGKNVQPERSPDEQMRKFDERLKSAKPLISLEFEPPMHIHVGKAGDITIDCPCMAFAGFDRAGIARVHLSPAATGSLLRALAAAGKILDERGEEPPTRTTH